MKAIKFILLTLFLVSFGSSQLLAQQQHGVLKGLALNIANGEVVPFANVIVKDSANNIVAGGTSDMNGLFLISPIAEGTYTVEAIYIGFNTETFKNVEIKNEKTTTITALLSEKVTMLEECLVVFEEPLIDKTGCRRTFTAEDIVSVSLCCCRISCYAQDTSKSAMSSDSTSLFPNPSSGELNIQSIDDVELVTVTTMNGQTVAEIKMDNPNQVTTNLHHLAPATYVVHFISGGQRVSKLWVLAH